MSEHDFAPDPRSSEHCDTCGRLHPERFVWLTAELRTTSRLHAVPRAALPVGFRPYLAEQLLPLCRRRPMELFDFDRAGPVLQQCIYCLRKFGKGVSLVTRIRTIKPEFWGSPDTAKASYAARLLYIAMWNWADDFGIGLANMKGLAGFAFENDPEITGAELPHLCKEVADCFGTKFYTVRGRTYYYIPSWDDHQKTERRAKRRNPGPEDPEATPDQQIHGNLGISLPTRGSTSEMSGNSPIGTGEREQGNRGTVSTPASPSEPAADIVQGELFEDDTAREVSTAIAVAEPVTARTIVAALIDACRTRGIELPQRIIGQYAKTIKQLLDEQQPPDRIWAALSLMAEDKILNRPSLLASKIVTVQTGPERAPARAVRSTIDDRVTGWLNLQFEPEAI